MDLTSLFEPRSIAIIGVSHDKTKVGYLVGKNLLEQGYKGGIYFINPKGGNILGQKVYKDLVSIKKSLDLAVISLPADVSLSVIEEVGKRGIKNIILFAAGFKETLHEGGREREAVLLELVTRYDLNVLGPNCIGYINTHRGINTTFLKHTSPKGNIAFVSQSGALGSMFVDYYVAHHNIGFSYFVSLGNKTVLDESDVLTYIAQDENTKVIGLYLEDVKNVDKFRNTLKTVTKKKPVVILKGGTTNEGSKAALSHTGGMIADNALYESLFRNVGAIHASDLAEFITILKMFSYERVPQTHSILVLSNAGGAGVVLTDDLVKNKLSLVTISDRLLKRLNSPRGDTHKITTRNPIDLLGDAGAFDYQTAIETTAKEKNIGAVIILLTPQANTQIDDTADVIISEQKRFSYPIFPVFLGESSLHTAKEKFEKARIASFSNIEYLPEALSKILEWKSALNTSHKEVLRKLRKLSEGNSKDDFFPPENIEAVGKILKETPQKVLALSKSLEILSLLEIKVTSSYEIASSEDLAKNKKPFAYPVVAKLISDKFSHKTEVGGVRTHIHSKGELMEVIRDFKRLDKKSRVLVQPLLSGPEILIGGKRDPHFGVVTAIGMGGIYTNLLKTVSLLLYPFDEDAFESAIRLSKVKKLCDGIRGSKPIDPIELFRIMTKVGELLTRFPEIAEIDINPLILHNGTPISVDCRIIL